MDAGCHNHCHVEQLVAVEGQVKLPGKEALWEATGVESGAKLQQVDQLSVCGLGVDRGAGVRSISEHTD